LLKSNESLHDGPRTARKHMLRSLLLIAGLSWGSVALAATPSAQPSKPVVVAYVFPQNNLIQPSEIAAQKLTRINYAFANVRGGRVVNGFDADGKNLAALVALKQENPSLTVLVSIGGWLWSGNFSDAALTTESRKIFIQSAVEFVEQYNLDGVDIDWEYPGQTGAGNHFRSADKQNYTLLLKELRERLNQEEHRLNRRLFITIATGASPAFLDHTEMGKVQQYVDTVNLMAYDYYEPSADPVTGHHAPLFTNPADPKRISADSSVRLYEKAGVPSEKIVLGVPFYGHVWGEVPDVNHGLFQPGKAVPNAFAQYRNIATSMLNNGFTRYWDSTASVPYLYNPEQKIFVSYEDPESLSGKSKYVLDHKLRGMMFWDYAGDPTGSLLDTIDTGLSIAPGGTK
jgi:chitinase